MSRIGNMPVALPAGVEATLGNGTITVKGPLGTLDQSIAEPLRVTIDKDKRHVVVERLNEERESKALHGLLRNLIANMAVGVTQGYSRAIQVVGVGYSAKLEGKTLVLQIGYSHPVKVAIPDGVTIDPPDASVSRTGLSFTMAQNRTFASIVLLLVWGCVPHYTTTIPYR